MFFYFFSSCRNRCRLSDCDDSLFFSKALYKTENWVSITVVLSSQILKSVCISVRNTRMNFSNLKISLTSPFLAIRLMAIASNKLHPLYPW